MLQAQDDLRQCYAFTCGGMPSGLCLLGITALERTVRSCAGWKRRFTVQCHAIRSRSVFLVFSARLHITSACSSRRNACRISSLCNNRACLTALAHRSALSIPRLKHQAVIRTLTFVSGCEVMKQVAGVSNRHARTSRCLPPLR